MLLLLHEKSDVIHWSQKVMSSDERCPRTLIVNAHFTEQSGSGTYLGRVFSSWSDDQLATVSAIPGVPDWSRCRRHYRTGELRFPLQAFSRWLLSSGPSGPVERSSLTKMPMHDATSVERVSVLRRILRYPWRMLLRIMGGGDLLLRSGSSLQLLEWARAFNPEVIYGHCSDLNSVVLLSRMREALGIPLVLHFMDDWSGTNYSTGWVAKLLRPRFETEFKRLVRSADITIAICREMAEEYEQRYQRSILWLPMPIELVAYQNEARTHWLAGQPFRIRYGGRVGWAIRESLVDVAQAVQSLRNEGVQVVFEIATFEPEALPAACREISGVTIQMPGSLADLPRLQSEADALLICYDFDPRSFEQARYSMPAKLAPCMASGTAVFVYGPAGLPVVEYARREGWGMIVDSRDPNRVKEALRELIGSEALRKKFGQTAQKLAADRHDAKAVSEELRQLLVRVANLQG